MTNDLRERIEAEAVKAQPNEYNVGDWVSGYITGAMKYATPRNTELDGPLIVPNSALEALLDDLDTNDSRFNRRHGGGTFKLGVRSTTNRVRQWLAKNALTPAPAKAVDEHEIPHAKNDMCIGCCYRWHKAFALGAGIDRIDTPKNRADLQIGRQIVADTERLMRENSDGD